MPRKITHSENQAYPPKQSDHTVHTISPMLFQSPIMQFKWTEDTSITGVATTGLDTLSASARHAPDQTAYRDLVDALPLQTSLRAAVRACTFAVGF